MALLLSHGDGSLVSRSRKCRWLPAIENKVLEVPMYASQDLPPQDRYHERDVVPRNLNSSDERLAIAGGGRPSIGRRMFRTVSRFFIAVLLGVGATLAWQSHGEEAKEMVRTWAPSVGSLLPASTTKSPASAAGLPRLGQQLETMTRDLAMVRSSLEQLAAKQEQMALYFAKVDGVEKPLSGPPSWASPILSPKPLQPAARGSAAQSSAVPPSPSPARQPVVLRP